MKQLLVSTTQNYTGIKKIILGLGVDSELKNQLSDENFELLNNFIQTVERLDSTFSDFILLQKAVTMLTVPSAGEKFDTDKLTVLIEQIKILNGLFHLDMDQLTVYPYVDCLEMLNQSRNDFDQASLLSSLFDYKNDKQGHELAWLFSEPSARPFDRLEMQSWFGKIVLVVIVHTLYHWFNLLSEDRQKNVLENYFWLAVQCGVSIPQTVGEVLYSTTNVAEYVVENKRLIDCLQTNTETITLAESSSLPLVQLLNTFTEQYKDVDSLDNDVQLFLNNTIKPEWSASEFADTLTQLLTSYIKLKEGVLINQNQAGAEDGPELLKRDLYNLVNWFSDKKTWPTLFSYFADENSLVSLPQFFKQFSDNISLVDNVEAAEKILVFVEEFKSKVPLGFDFEPIIFNESTSQFEWNPDLLS